MGDQMVRLILRLPKRGGGKDGGKGKGKKREGKGEGEGEERELSYVKASTVFSAVFPVSRVTSVSCFFFFFFSILSSSHLLFT